MLGQSHLRCKPCFCVRRKPAFGAIQPTTLGMGAAETQEIAAIIAGVLRATAPTKTASRTGRLAGKPSLANYTLDEPARFQDEGRARDLLGRFPLYPEIQL